MVRAMHPGYILISKSTGPLYKFKTTETVTSTIPHILNFTTNPTRRSHVWMHKKLNKNKNQQQIQIC